MNSKEFVERRIDAFRRGDIETLVNDYKADSVIMTPMGNMVGADQARGMIAGFISEFSMPGTIFEVTRTNCTDQVAHFAWKADTPKTTYKFGNETYFLDKDGKVMVHVFDGDMAPK